MCIFISCALYSHKRVMKCCVCISLLVQDYIASIICFSLNSPVVSTESYHPASCVCVCVCEMFLLPYGLSLQPSLLRAIFNVDPDEVRALILKKEDVNVQVRLARNRPFPNVHRSAQRHISARSKTAKRAGV